MFSLGAKILKPILKSALYRYIMVHTPPGYDLHCLCDGWGRFAAVIVLCSKAKTLGTFQCFRSSENTENDCQKSALYWYIMVHTPSRYDPHCLCDSQSRFCFVPSVFARAKTLKTVSKVPYIGILWSTLPPGTIHIACVPVRAVSRPHHEATWVGAPFRRI